MFSNSGTQTDILLNNQSIYENIKTNNSQTSKCRYSKEVLDYCNILYGRCANELDEQAIKEAQNFFEQDGNK